jgi:hypothetical protein
LNYGAYSALRLRVANRVGVIRVGQRGGKVVAFNVVLTNTYQDYVCKGTTPSDLLTSSNQLKKALNQNNGKYFMINVRYRAHD